MTINERIKFLRKEKKLNQKKFGELLGISQSGVSFIEQNGTAVANKTIITICSTLNISRQWLEQGIGPMEKENSFDLNSYIEEQQASEIEIAILRAYFDLDKDVREMLIKHFKKLFENKNSIK